MHLALAKTSPVWELYEVKTDDRLSVYFHSLIGDAAVVIDGCLRRGGQAALHFGVFPINPAANTGCHVPSINIP